MQTVRVVASSSVASDMNMLQIRNTKFPDRYCMYAVSVGIKLKLFAHHPAGYHVWRVSVVCDLDI